jgi:nucleotide sugar dehydrogenase
MKKIAVIGYGYVGKVVADFFKDHFDVVARDIDKEFVWQGGIRVEHTFSSDDWLQVNNADLAVVCVPTPMGSDGSVDLGALESVISKIKTPLILIKSTIPPGTTRRLVERTGKQIVFSPEFIGEGKYVVQWWKDKGYPHPTDMKYHDFQIFGGEREAAIAVLQFFKTVLGPEAKYFLTDSTTAELCKYMENAWSATKVTFCNEFFEIAKAFGVSYDELRELWLLDGRVERMHTAVFFDRRGFGGKCLPKDVNGIVRASCKAGYEPRLLQEVLASNDRIRKSALN